MLQKLKVVPRFLAVVRSYIRDGPADEYHISSEFNGSGVLEAYKQNYNDVVEFCLITRLLKKEGHGLVLTELGNTILEYGDGNYELTELQKDTIVRKCFFEGGLSERIVGILEEFTVRTADGILWYPKDKIAYIDEQVLPLLYQVDALMKADDDNVVYLNPKYSSVVAFLLGSQTIRQERFSPEALKELREVQSDVGEIAEEIVMSFEKKRLAHLNCIGESSNIERTSLLDVSAGYDIKSYDSDGGPLMRHDRFVEVKGSTGMKLSFFLSSTEKRKAEELGSKYWLYFVGGIDIGNRSAKMAPMMFRDPISTIMQDRAYHKECVKMWITSGSIDNESEEEISHKT